MMQKTLVGRCAWILAVAGAVVGCGDSSGAGSGGSGGANATTSSTATAATNSSSSVTGTGTGSGTGGGTPVSDCTALLLQECKQEKLCAPHQFALHWETDAICEAEAVRLCTDLPSAYDAIHPGVTAPAACTAAVTGTCDQYLKNLDIRPDACRPLPGDKVNELDGCLIDAQCGPDMECFPNQFPGNYGGCASFCAKYSMQTGNMSCLNSDDICNPSKGSLCTHPYDATTPNKIAVPDSTTCHTISYQPLGAGCQETTDKRCDSGLGCKAPTLFNAYTCVSLLSEGQTCKLGDVVGKDPCDTRLGLQCLPNPAAPATAVCTAPLVVPVNAQCGMVPDANNVVHNQICSNYAYCSTTTSLCVRKSNKGEGCVAGGCYAPYACTAGVCADPLVLVDPVCTP